jgi:hypothetical protein
MKKIISFMKESGVTFRVLTDFDILIHDNEFESIVKLLYSDNDYNFYSYLLSGRILRN